MKRKPKEKKSKKPKIVVMKDKAGTPTIVSGADRMNLSDFKIEVFYCA